MPRAALALALLCVSPALAAAGGKALCVGVDRYDREPRLQCCGRDAEALGALLRDEFGFDATVLSQGAAKADPALAPDALRFRRHLKSVCADCVKEDTLVIMFSGHGNQSAKRRDVVLSPADGDPDQKQSEVALSEIFRHMGESAAGQKWLILDACRSMPSPDAEPAGAKPKPTPAALPNVPDGVVVLLACADGEMSYELPTRGHGALVHHLLGELRPAAEAGKSVDAIAAGRRAAQATFDAIWQQEREKQSAQVLLGKDAALTLEPPGAASLRDALAHAAAGRLAEAEAALDAGLTAAPAAPRLLAERSWLRLWRGDAEGAAADADKALQLSPESCRALDARASVRMDRCDYADALRDAEAACRADPDSGLPLATRSLARLQLGDGTEALEDARLAARLAPTRADSWRALAYAAETLCADREALDAARAGLKLAPWMADLHLVAGRECDTLVSRAEAVRHFDAGLKLAEAQVAKTPASGAAWAARVDLLLALRRTEAALDAARAWGKLAPRDPNQALAEGDALSARGELAAADAALTRAHRLEPRLPGALLRRSVVRRKQFRKAEARADAAAARALAPGSLYVLDELARQLVDDEPAESERACDEAVRRYPQSWRAYALRSEHLLFEGRPERVLADLDAARRLAPDHPFPLLFQANALSELGDAGGAARAYDAALALAPACSSGWYWRGSARLYRRDHAGAVADLRKAADLDPDFPDLLADLGQALYEHGDYPAALAALDRSVELKEDSADVWLFRAKARLMLGTDDVSADLSRSDNRLTPEADVREANDLSAWWAASGRLAKTDGVSYLIATNPREPLYRVVRARAYRNAKKPELALAELSRLVERHPAAALPRLERARLHLDAKRLAEAQADLDAALKAVPGCAAARRLALELRGARGESEAALADAASWAAAEPAEPSWPRARAELLLTLNRPALALAPARAARELAPDDLACALVWLRALDALQADESFARIADSPRVPSADATASARRALEATRDALREAPAVLDRLRQWNAEAELPEADIRRAVRLELALARLDAADAWIGQYVGNHLGAAWASEASVELELLRRKPEAALKWAEELAAGSKKASELAVLARVRALVPAQRERAIADLRKAGGRPLAYALAAKARELAARGDTTAALAALSDSGVEDRDAGPLRLARADVLLASKELAAAEAALRDAARDLELTDAALARARLARLLESAGRLPEAAREWEAARELTTRPVPADEPDDAAARAARAWWFDRVGSTEHARAEFGPWPRPDATRLDRAAALDLGLPVDADALLADGHRPDRLLARRLREAADAAALTRALGHVPPERPKSPEASGELAEAVAVALLRLDRLGEAADLLDARAKLSPPGSLDRLNARLKAARGDHAGAEAAFSKLLAADPADRDARARRAACRLALNRRADAVADWQVLADAPDALAAWSAADPSATSPPERLAFHHVGSVWERIAQAHRDAADANFGDALARLDEAEKIAPLLSRELRLRAGLLNTLGRAEDAKRATEAADAAGRMER